MAKQNSYNCILYEVGDKVTEKYGNNEILEIENADLRHVGIYPTQFLKFKGKPVNIGAFSNLYIPAAETIEKYKDGLKYFNEVKVKWITARKEAVKRGTKIHSMLAKQILKKEKEIIDLNDETIFKTRIIPAGMFKVKTKENGEKND